MDETRKSFLNLLKSASDLIGADPESVKNYLEQEGYDYDKLRKSGEDLGNKLLLRAQAAGKRAALEERVNRARLMILSVKGLPERKLDNMQALFQQKYGNRYAKVNFRDLKNMTEDEALSILSDIEILEFIEANNV